MAKLTPDQAQLCLELDDFHRESCLLTQADGTPRRTPTEMFRGALFALEAGRRENNPDWIAQAAHSLREVVYPLHSQPSRKRKGINPEFVRGELTSFLEEEKDLKQDFDPMYEALCDFAHHHLEADFGLHTQAEFGRLLAEFERVMTLVLARRSAEQNQVDRDTVGAGPPLTG